MTTIRPNALPAATTVLGGDIFLIDGTTGVRALDASKVALKNATSNTFTGVMTVGTLNQFGSLIAARSSTVPTYEFGHLNPAGYGSVFACDTGSGAPYILFCGSPGTTVNTYKTLGNKGSLFGSDLAGGFIFATIATASADNQAQTPLGTWTTSGLLTVAGGVLSSAPRAGVGYATGAGGTVTQATSKATGVTLNTVAGAITMNAAALAAGTIVSFVLTDSAIAATDVLLLNHISGGTPGSYSLNARCGAGSATIDIRNNTAGSLSEAIVVQFALIKAVNA